MTYDKWFGDTVKLSIQNIYENIYIYIYRKYVLAEYPTCPYDHPSEGSHEHR